MSAGARYTGVGDSGLTHQGALLILGYRTSADTRVGVFADRSLEIGAPAGITQTLNEPSLGVFADWAVSGEGRGISLRAAAAFSSSDLTIRRLASTTTEPGQGRSALRGRAFEIRARHASPLGSSLTALPYLGLRYARMAHGAYSEHETQQVAWPVNYAGMTQGTFSAVAGVNFAWRVTESLTALAGVGGQRALADRIATQAGSSDIPDLLNFSVPLSGGRSDTLGSADLGVAYAAGRAGRLTLAAQWKQLPASGQSATSVMVTWSAGF